MRRVGSYILGLLEECTSIGRPCLVDRVSSNAMWIQHGTVLADGKTREQTMLLPVATQRLLGEIFRGAFGIFSNSKGVLISFGGVKTKTSYSSP